MTKKKLHEADQRRPFGVDYVPKPKRAKLDPKGIYVGKRSEIPPGKAKAVDTDQYRVAVYNVEGKFYAIKDACPHAEYSLSKGSMKDEVVMCASHNWQFNVRTGQCVRGDTEIVVRTFEVEIRGDEVWIKS